MLNRNYNTLFSNKSVSGSIASVNSLVGGSDYVDGTYEDVPLIGGSGSGATADITVLSGVVTTVTIVIAGSNYQVGDILSVDNANLGGAGSGFSINVATLSSTSTDFVSQPFQLDHVKAEYRKPQLKIDGTLDSGSMYLQSLRPDKNLNNADMSYSSTDWGDHLEVAPVDLINLSFSTLNYRLRLQNIGTNANLSAWIIYNAE